MKRASTALLLLLTLLLLASCAAAPKPERASEEELARLREEYPISDELSPVASYDFDPCQTWEGLAETTSPHTIVVVEITGDRFVNTIYASPFSNAQANAAIGLQRLDGQFFPAKVLKCLGGEFELKKGDEIALAFGANGIAPPAILDAAYQTGNRYVCFLKDISDLKTSYTVENMYRATKYQTFYLTDDDVLLTMTSYIACMNECSGMYLDAFEQLLPEVLGPGPDAEITDPTPEEKAE